VAENAGQAEKKQSKDAKDRTDGTMVGFMRYLSKNIT
jgi:hypothetical protein